MSQPEKPKRATCDPETFLKAFVKVAKAGGSYADIAQITGLSTAQVASRATTLRSGGIPLPQLRRSSIYRYDFPKLKALYQQLEK